MRPAVISSMAEQQQQITLITTTAAAQDVEECFALVTHAKSYAIQFMKKSLSLYIYYICTFSCVSNNYQHKWKSYK
jgi:hypothetical protein